jgi:hypothetical protein
MFELHVVVVGIVMFNIIELIMKIVPNYPTKSYIMNLVIRKLCASLDAEAEIFCSHFEKKHTT